MSGSPSAKRSRATPPPRPDPIPGIGHGEVSKPIWGNPFKWMWRKLFGEQSGS
jgi:hypothetical protein